MGQTNNTLIVSSYHSGSSILHPYEGGCMAGVKKAEGDVKIIIPFSEVNDRLTEQEILEYTEIGSSLIFPAKIERGFSTKKSVPSLFNTGMGHSIFKKNLKGRTVTLKPFKNYSELQYRESEYYSKGTIVGLSHPDYAYIDNITPTDKYRGSTIYNYTIAHISMKDFLLDDGTTVYETLLRSIDEVKAVLEKEGDNCYIVTFNADKCVSDYHKLAVLTFYRYLYSPKYTRIPRTILNLVRSGMDAWDALYVAHSIYMPNYDSYYGLTKVANTEYLSMEQVLTSLKSSDVNNSFSGRLQPSQDKQVLLMCYNSSSSVENLYNVLKILKEDVSIKISEIVCSTNKLKTLTEGKKYKPLKFNSTFVKIEGDDYVTRWYKRDHFLI